MDDQKTRYENLLRKARALLELARRGGTEAESRNAEEKLLALVAKYNLDMAEITADKSSAVITPTEVPGKYNETWRSHCYMAAAKMYMCNYFFRRVSGDKDCSVIHFIVGEEHNVAVAVEMGAYFEQAINRFANESAKTAVHLHGNEHTQRHRFIRSFRLSATVRLIERVNEYVRKAREGGIVDEDSGTTLPALASLYDRANALYEAWIKDQEMTLTSKASRDKQLSSAGRRAGREAGDKIALSGQISSGSSAGAFALT